MKGAATPQAFNTGMEVAEMNSPQTLRRGNSAFSTSATRQPSCANSRAAAAPAGPAPITTASSRMTRREEMGEGKDAALFDQPTGWPQCRQFAAVEARAHAGDRVMAGHVIGAQGKDQMRPQQGKRGAAR